MFGQRRRLRLIAAHMLLVWFFALASGVANACIVEPELRNAALSGSHDHSGNSQAHQHSHSGGSIGQEDPSQHSDNAPCVKFCEQESIGTPPVKQQVDPASAVPLAPPPSAALTVQMVLERAGAFRVEPAFLLYGRIPIPIAFLRLTL